MYYVSDSCTKVYVRVRVSYLVIFVALEVFLLYLADNSSLEWLRILRASKVQG